ncbi:MAG: NADH-quinone oxidoreductase subunit L [Alphaproteobacteria bacterium MarineAlpha8_Bin1]|nr:MAG: NADH-quinone oxidoreductase subunit L [Alphaproteobacteria bacterium MarineAlpha8_Bin1]
MFLFAIFLPLLSFFLSIFLNKIIKDSYINIISCSLLVLSAVFSLCSIFFLGWDQQKTYIISSWIVSGSFSVDWSINYNLLTCSMVLMVNFVSSLIHIYSVGYMVHDSKRTIFLGYLSLFTFFMLVLVSSSNLVQLFLGWEGVGLASYLLIGFWNHKNVANNAALKAFVVNRIGDFGILIGLFATFMVFGTLNINEILILVNSHIDSYFNFLGLQIHSLTLIAILFFVGCMGKSAQFGLHIWLPDAMEGPTPVSALIHAATMVTAGVFLLILVSPILEASDFSRTVIIIVGSITCIFAASVAFFQNDIKRIIAYSTCSQLGYMFMAIGASAYNAAYFHILSHAFFKALLFLSAGSVIHSMSDEQNIKKMGGLFNKIPMTYLCMLIGSIALVGLPFFSGYFSKDLILELIYLGDSKIRLHVFSIGVLAVFFTSLYSARLMIYVFHGKSQADEKVLAHIHESPKIMIIPLVILSFFSIFFGMFSYDFFFGYNSNILWSEHFFINSELNDKSIIDNIPIYIKKSPLIMILLGISFSILIYYPFKQILPFIKEKLILPYKFFCNKWYIDEIYNFLIVRPIIYLGKGFWKSIDMDLIDTLGPNGISNLVKRFGIIVSSFQSGFLYHYALSVIIGLTLFVSLYVHIF